MRSTLARAAAWPASRLRRRLGPSGPARALVQARVPAGGGEHGGVWEGAGAHQPRQGVLGALVGVVPTTAWPSAGDHATWSLGEGGPVASSSGGPTRFGGGAACGRGAAAVCEERCRLGTDRALTSENSGGRD